MRKNADAPRAKGGRQPSRMGFTVAGRWDLASRRQEPRTIIHVAFRLPAPEGPRAVAGGAAERNPRSTLRRVPSPEGARESCSLVKRLCSYAPPGLRGHGGPCFRGLRKPFTPGYSPSPLRGESIGRRSRRPFSPATAAERKQGQVGRPALETPFDPGGVRFSSSSSPSARARISWRGDPRAR